MVDPVICQVIRKPSISYMKQKKLEVTAKHSKNSKKSGVIVKNDYVEVIKKYVADSDCKYRVDEIMKSYDVILLRLPPYISPGIKCHW